MHAIVRKNIDSWNVRKERKKNQEYNKKNNNNIYIKQRVNNKRGICTETNYLIWIVGIQ